MKKLLKIQKRRSGFGSFGNKLIILGKKRMGVNIDGEEKKTIILKVLKMIG